MRVACAALLDERGDREQAKLLLAPTRSVAGMMFLAELFASPATCRGRCRWWSVCSPATSTRRGRATGYQKLVKAGAFEEMGSPELCGAIDALLGPGSERAPKKWGPPLVAFPEAPEASPGEWELPHEGWHFDGPVGGSEAWGVRVFLLLDRIEACSGATLVASGLPRIARRVAAEEGGTLRSARTKRAISAREPWVRALLEAGEGDARAERFLRDEPASDGTPLRVVELTGEPGDVVFMDQSSLHAQSPNTGRRPRMVIAQSVFRKGWQRTVFAERAERAAS